LAAARPVLLLTRRIAFFTTRPSGSGTTIFVRQVGHRRASDPANGLTKPLSAMARTYLSPSELARTKWEDSSLGLMVELWLLYTIGGAMALNIKDREAERLAAEVAAMTGESKTRAVKVALQERKERLVLRVVRRDRGQALRRFLEQEVWPEVPRTVLGCRVTRREREAILGYGPDGL
jgi:antitoxin VapB